MDNQNLFDLTHNQLADLANLEELLEATGGEITEDAEALLDQIAQGEDDILSKLDSYAVVIAQMELDAEAYEAKAAYLRERMDTMKARANSKRRVVDSLKDRIMLSMKMLGMKKAETPNHVSVSVRTAKAPVVIEDESLVPDEFAKITRRPDKTAIGKALAAGLECDFAALGEGKEYVVLR
jgi:DNA primase large subunit